MMDPSSSSSTATTVGGMTGGGGGGGIPFVSAWIAAASQRYQHLLDKSTPHVLRRWLGFLFIAFVYVVRVAVIQGFYIVSYGLGIYVLNLLIAFLSPQVDPEIQELVDGAGPTLPTRSSDEYRPFVRRLPEFKFWYGSKIVAIKVLNSGDTPEEKATLKGRFIREVNMMRRVKHENLVKFIGACMEPFMVIITELLPGMSLKNYLNSIRPQQLDLYTAISFAHDIARAMDCLHANGIIHRDLKPDNLLLTADQKNIKLIDFGLAREETVTEMMTAETGTYRWMAPELYSTVTLRRGEKKHYTNKVDVYSFGIVLWELLTNRMPFEGMSNLQAAYAAAFKQVRPPLPEDAPPELVFVVQSCWVEDPNSRPCFNQIIRMLNAFLFTLPPPSLPVPEAVSNVPAVPMSKETTIASPSRKGHKLSFIRQLFAAKKAVNNKT